MSEVYEFIYRDPAKAYMYFKVMIALGVVVAGALFYAAVRPPARFENQTPKPLLGVFSAVFVFAIFIAAAFKASVPPGGIVSIRVDDKSLTLRSILPEREIRIPQSNIEFLEIVNNRLVIKSRDQQTYLTPVIYQGDQAEHLQSIVRALGLEQSGAVLPVLK